MDSISLVVSVVGGTATGLGIAYWLAKRELSRIVEVVDRVPEKEWFERIEALLSSLASSQGIQATDLAIMKDRLERFQIQQERDHERLGKLQADVVYLLEKTRDH